MGSDLVSWNDSAKTSEEDRGVRRASPPDPLLQGLTTALTRACFLGASQALRKGGHETHFTDEETEVTGTTSNCTNTT